MLFRILYGHFQLKHVSSSLRYSILSGVVKNRKDSSPGLEIIRSAQLFPADLPHPFPKLLIRIKYHLSKLLIWLYSAACHFNINYEGIRNLVAEARGNRENKCSIKYSRPSSHQSRRLIFLSPLSDYQQLSG